MNNNEKILDVSWKTILRISIAFLIFYVLYVIRSILVWIVFALIISVLLNPAIDFLQRRKLPRIIATVLVYVSIFVIFGLLIYLIAPPFGSEIQRFFNRFPQYFAKASPFLGKLGIEAFKNMEAFRREVSGWVSRDIVDIFKSTAAIFGGIFSAVSIFAMAMFFSLEERGVEKTIGLLSPKKYEKYILNLWESSQQKVVEWFGVRILACVFVGLMTTLACFLFNIKYAVSFGFMAGVLDIIPIIGPIIAGSIIVLFSILISPWKALFVLIAFILIQQIEGNILTPALTRKIIGLPPILVFISLLVGGELWGILGAILAIPLTGILFEFTKDFLKRKKEETIA